MRGRPGGAPATPTLASTTGDDYGAEIAGPSWGWRILLILLFLSVMGAGGWYGVTRAEQTGWMEQLRVSYRDVSLLPSQTLRPSRPELEIQVYYVVGERSLDWRTVRLRDAPTGDAERLELIRQALNAPNGADAARSPLPGGTKVKGVYLLDGIVWLDLTKDFLQTSAPSAMGERLTVYALVNTFLINAPNLQGVRLLVEGQPIRSAWGWLDLGSPLAVNLSLLG